MILIHKRVEELAKQADEYLLDKVQEENRSSWAQVFAELIVGECIERITNYDLIPGHSAKWEDIYYIHSRLLQDLGEDLKEHFGVEE